MEYCPDNLTIKNCERNGYPDSKEPEMPKCPICHEDCNSFFKNSKEQEIVGCENCMKIIDSYFLDGD